MNNLIKGKKHDWEMVIGLAIHAQVKSNSKLFSSSSTKFGSSPNSQVSLVDAAMPGMLPVINKYCVEQAVKTGVGLNAKMRAESMFGKTALPLWIVYGMGGGAHYKHTKDEFEAKSKEEIESMGASMNVPYMVISIAKSTKNPTYNAIYVYVLVNALNDKNGLQPQYMEMQFINRSGSTWSYKIDANKIVTGVPK